MLSYQGVELFGVGVGLGIVVLYKEECQCRRALWLVLFRWMQSSHLPLQLLPPAPSLLLYYLP